jgi:D-ribose pyranose/furanose isomerase RbsD
MHDVHEHAHKWINQMEQMLKLFGHRNWVLIADSAFPMLSSNGVKTLATETDHVEVLRTVLGHIQQCPHIRPVVYIDEELAHIDEQDAPGITTLRQQFNQLLNGIEVHKQAHLDLINKVSEAAKLFHVLVLKTTITLPYTTVFIELDCGYWDSLKEDKLRKRMRCGTGSHNAP